MTSVFLPLSRHQSPPFRPPPQPSTTFPQSPFLPTHPTIPTPSRCHCPPRSPGVVTALLAHQEQRLLSLYANEQHQFETQFAQQSQLLQLLSHVTTPPPPPATHTSYISQPSAPFSTHPLFLPPHSSFLPLHSSFLTSHPSPSSFPLPPNYHPPSLNPIFSTRPHHPILFALQLCLSPTLIPHHHDRTTHTPETHAPGQTRLFSFRRK